MNVRPFAGLVLGVALVVGACGGPPDATTPGGPQAKPVPVSREQALADFELVRSVLQHPRCQNCHPGGDVPLQGDNGIPHTQNVMRGPEGKGNPGEECTTCHGPANPPDSYGKHIPPGVSTGWHMPGPDNKLVFVGLSPAAICEQVKDPVKNGGKNTEALIKHVDDPLVTWAWNPGVGRTRLPVDQPTFKKAWNEWVYAGSPCPAGAPGTTASR